MRLAAGKGSNGIPIPIPMAGAGSGKGTNGAGQKTGTLKENTAGNPKVVAVGKNGSVSADARASKEFLKYAAMGSKPSKFKPNAKIQGVRNKSFNELQQNFKGDPNGQYVSGTPLYNQYMSGKRSLESPVNKEQIPAAYRKQVKEYFEAISPGK